MTVVSFAKAKEERSPHWSGTCKCIGCGHEWVGVAPIGVMWIDCPSCELPKGHPKYPFGASGGDSLFVCDCGSEALTAYYHKGHFRLRCMACGADHTEGVCT